MRITDPTHGLSSLRPLDFRPSGRILGESVRFYLPAIDGLRFLAFILVFIHHIKDEPWWMSFVKQHGWIGVELFFVISGFLFFSLLELEDRKSGTINIANFYFRRLLRLYPLMVAFPAAMWILFEAYTADSFARLLGIAFFSDNLLAWLHRYNGIFASGQLWTLSYEFQIYLFTPLAFLLYRSIGARKFLWFLIAFWLVACGARLTFILLGAKHPIIWVTPFLRPESTLIGMAMAIGFLAGLRPIVILAMAGSAFVAFSLLPDVKVVGIGLLLLYPVSGLICGALLWISVNHNQVRLVLSQPWIVFLGKISFGLYVFHLLAIWMTKRVLHASGIPVTRGFWNYGLRFAIALGLTVVMATASYFLFERYFLRVKTRFSAVESRPI